MKKPTLSVLDSVKDQLANLGSEQEKLKLLLSHLGELEKNLLKERTFSEEKQQRIKILEAQLKSKTEEMALLQVACDRMKIRMGVLQEEVQSKQQGGGFFGSLGVFSKGKPQSSKQEELQLRLDQSLQETGRIPSNQRI